MDYTIFQQLGVAVLFGILVGLERERKYQRYACDAFGGVRTLALVGLLGALAQILTDYSVVIAAGFFALLAISYYFTAKKYNKIGATSEIASALVFIVGIFSGMEEYVLVAIVAIVTLSALYFKDFFHGWAKNLKNQEIVSTIQFAVIAFVILPLLPDQTFGPYGFFNPYLVWLMVVFISGISYLSYIAIKIFGEKKGIGVTGFLAGFISSTALTMSFSGQSRENRKIINPYVIAVVIASSAMFFRILVEVAVLNPGLLEDLLIPMVAMGGTGTLSILFFWFKKNREHHEVGKEVMRMKSPFSLWPAIKFGAFFAIILFLIKVGNEFFGDNGIYVTSVVSGFVDVDAITVSMANLAKSADISNISAVYAITIAAMTNTFVKGCIFLFFGNGKVGIRIAGVFALMLIVGGGALMFIN